MLRRRGQLDVVGEGTRQQWMTVGVLELNRQFQLFAGPRHWYPKTETNGQTGMSRRKPVNPERVPSPAEDEEFAPDRLHRIR